jgi:hypothetical protein
MMSPTSIAIGPIQPSERIEVLDILRGWAVFGILLADMVFNLSGISIRRAKVDRGPGTSRKMVTPTSQGTFPPFLKSVVRARAALQRLSTSNILIP